MKRGTRKLIPAPRTPKRLHTFGAYNWRTSHVSCTLNHRKNSDSFIEFLERLTTDYPTETLVLVMDNASYHRSKAVQAALSLFEDLLSPIAAQSAEKGSYPEVMCATEEGLKQQTLYGPTRRAETVGPVDENQLAEHALNQEDAAKLWTISEQNTSFSWSL